jgi:hypothetical protein
MAIRDPFDQLTDQELAATLLHVATRIAERLAPRPAPVIESELVTLAGLIPARGRGRPKGGPTSAPEVWAPPRQCDDCGSRMYTTRVQNRVFCRKCEKKHRQPGMDFRRHCEECGCRVYTSIAEDRHKCRKCLEGRR